MFEPGHGSAVQRSLCTVESSSSSILLICYNYVKVSCHNNFHNLITWEVENDPNKMIGL